MFEYVTVARNCAMQFISLGNDFGLIIVLISYMPINKNKPNYAKSSQTKLNQIGLLAK